MDEYKINKLSQQRIYAAINIKIEDNNIPRERGSKITLSIYDKLRLYRIFTLTNP